MHRPQTIRSITVIALLLLAACSSAEVPTPTPSAAPTATTVAATPRPRVTPSATPPPVETVEPSAAQTGLTLWYGYTEDSAEARIVGEQVARSRQAHPDQPVNVLHVEGDALINKFEIEAAAGGGPDLLIVPNETIGREARAGLLAAIDQPLSPARDRFMPAALDGVRVDGTLYGVPLTRSTVALYRNRERVPDAPASTQALLDAAKSGTRVVLIRSIFHNYGFVGAFGGRLLDDNGRCIADQGGFDAALDYLDQLKAAGVVFATSGAEAAELFRAGEADITIDGSWMLSEYSAALGDRLGVGALPSGPAGPATPMIGGTSVVVNAGSDQVDQAVALALLLASPEAQQQLADQTQQLPVLTDVPLANDALGGLAAAALSGTPRPQRAELDMFWRPFDAALADTLDTDTSPAELVQQACATMNANNGKE